MSVNLLDNFPTWVIYLSFLIIFFLFVEIGLLFGRRVSGDNSKLIESRKTHVRVVLGGIFTLVAFLLAFTFSVAGSQYNARRHLMIDHENAISTTYLRADQMAEPHCSKIKDLLRAYTKLRINIDDKNFAGVMQKTEQLERQLWAEATLITQKDRSPIVSLFVHSLNDMIDLRGRRLNVALWTRIPGLLIITLTFLSALVMLLYGFLIGLTQQREYITRSLLVLVFATVFLLVIDLDRPKGGIFKISQQPMIELYKDMNK